MQDQPKAALDMITAFTHGGDVTGGQPITSDPVKSTSARKASHVRAGHLIVQ